MRKTRSFFTKTALACSLFGLGLVGCSNVETAGGGSSGTEAGNAIYAQILDLQQKPAAKASIKLTPRDALDNSGSYTATADKDGSVSIENVADGEYIMEARLGGGALQRTFTVTNSKKDLGSNQLEEMASISGSLEQTSEGTIQVRGLEHSADVINGEFTLDSLPAGHLDLVFIPKESNQEHASSYVNLKAGTAATASTFATEHTSLLLDDFQDNNNQHRFGPMYFGPSDGGWWYVTSAKNVIIKTGTDKKGVLKLEKDGDNVLLHTTLDFDSLYGNNGEASWASIGVQIGDNEKKFCYDFSSVEAVKFKAKGTGNIIFKLVDETHKTDSFDGVFATSHLGLSEDWETYSVNLAKIIDKRAGNLNCVTMITWDFEGRDNVDFWLDDVELVGGERTKIWESKGEQD